MKTNINSLTTKALRNLLQRIDKRFNELASQDSNIRVVFKKVKAKPTLTRSRLEYEMAKKLSPRTGRPLQAQTLAVYLSNVRSVLGIQRKYVRS